MSPSRVIIFTSPKAGSGAAREQIPRLASLLETRSIPCQTLHEVDQLKDVCQQASEALQPQPTVVAAGGDGTLSLVASLTGPETPLVPMPMGTENLLARYLEQKSDAEDVLETILTGKPLQIDAGLANDRLFLIMSTVGYDAEVVRRLHLRRKGHIRRHSYLKPMIQTLWRYPFPDLQVSCFDANGKLVNERKAPWAMVFNLPCYAVGLQIEPAALGTDQQLNVVTFDGRGFWSGLKYVVGIWSRRHLTFKDIQRVRASRVEIESSHRVAYELDGDYVGRLPLKIKALPGRVRLMVKRQRWAELDGQSASEHAATLSSGPVS